MLDSQRTYWNALAATFDEELDHGLLEPSIRETWRRLLVRYLPPTPADIVDVGCGTGTLSVLLAESGYNVRGLDVAEAMVAAATEKARLASAPVTFVQGDAAAPPYELGSCDVVLSRHVLWAMSDPSTAVRRWCELLRPEGRLLLIEGRWFTGSGITAADCEGLIREHRSDVQIVRLDDQALWGQRTDDERYLAVSTR